MDNFEQAERFAQFISDCGVYYAPFEEFRQFNTEQYPDYGTALLMLYAGIEQKSFEVSPLRKLIEQTLKNQGDVLWASKAETLSKAVWSIAGAVNIQKMDETVRNILGKSAEKALQELRVLFYQKGYVDCIYEEVSSSDEVSSVTGKKDDDFGTDLYDESASSNDNGEN